MKIVGTSMAMQSQHYQIQQTQENERLRVWVDSPPAEATRVTLSQSAPPSDSGADTNPPTDMRITLLLAILEWLTGKPVKIFDGSQLQNPASAEATTTDTPAPASASSTPPSAGFGVEYDHQVSSQEVEQTDFAAQGTVVTADGRHIGFSVQVDMTRSYSEQSNTSLRLGDAARRKDPLVVNLGGTAAQLSTQRMNFDLDSDGKAEKVAMLAGGSAYLAIDKNGNGKIDSGAELFGPSTGSGFAELASYDADGNGWIDENDPVFKQLLLWTPDSSEKGQLATISKGNIGALFTGSAATPFELRSPQNADLGAVKASGAYLMESGQAGTLQEVDLTV